jgi:hypothetical protein
LYQHPAGHQSVRRKPVHTAVDFFEDSDSVVWIYEERDTRAQQEKYFSWRRVETGLVDAISSFLTAPPRAIWLDQK